MASGWEDSTPFLVVAGAGHSPVDGRYAQDGFREGKPKFKKVGGEFIIFFRWGMWKLGAEEDTTVWLYESSTGSPGSPTSPTNSSGASSMPPSAWVAAQAKHGPAPSVSLGTCRDLQEGDVVTIVKHHEEVDWSGCPERSEEHKLLCRPGEVLSIHRLRRLRGNWFYPSECPEKVAPLAALGTVNLMGKAHRITKLEPSTVSFGEDASSMPFLVLNGAGHSPINGRYSHEGSFSGKPKYKQVGGNSIIFFMSGKWRLNDEDVTDERCYDAVEGDEPMPPSAWVKINNRYGAAPKLSIGTCRDLQVGDSVVLEKDSRSIDWSGCPESRDSSRRFSFSAPKTVTVHRLQGEWFYPAEFRTLVAPVAAVGSVNFNGKAHRVEALEETSASSGENTPTAPATPSAFLVVQGAGHAAVNGRYVPRGMLEGRPKYKQVGGNSIIYFSSGVWRLNDEENMQQRKYDGAQNDTPTPPNQWVQVDSNHGAAPKLSVGTWRDIQEGDTVTLGKRHEDVDWSGCPVNSAGRLRFSPSPWSITVQRVQGQWFYPAEFETLIAPLAALGTVNLMGETCQVAEVMSSSSRPEQKKAEKGQKGKEKILGGYDEEWSSGQDVQKYKCAICLLVARDAVVHECGSDLFCEGCWKRCMAKDSKCPVCRKDGASIVPAHFERRSILNLKVKCPNPCCGRSVPLHEKETHLENGTCASNAVSFDGLDVTDEANKEVCTACIIS